MGDLGVHKTDLLRYILGEEIVEVGAFVETSAKDFADVTAYLKFENGASLLFETSWAANIKDDQEHLSISGVDGGLSVFPFELYTTRNGMLLNSEAA